METWAIIMILFLFLIFGGLAGFTWWVEHTNSKAQQNNIVYPFSGAIDPTDTTNPVVLTGAGGTPQIQCPEGTVVNIIGAWVEVNDPFGECSSPSATFRATCGDDSTSSGSSAVTCSNAGDCASGMDCISGKCVASTCSAASDCGAQSCPVGPGTSCKTDTDCGGPPMACVGGKCIIDPGQGQCTFCNNGKCAQGPTCSNLNASYENQTCVFSNPNTKCRPRDASAYLAIECDGKQTCDISWNPSNPKYFGPLPCNIGVADPEYAGLPIIPGWNGSKPAGGTGGPEKADFKQGYYVHGIFTCVPK